MQTGSVSWRSRPLRTTDVTSFSTFVGGSPCAFGADADRPSCARCGAPLFLVLQLYAPATCERQLLLFGCNGSACAVGGARGGGAWVALRTRGPPIAATTTSATAEPAAAPETDDWGVAAAWGDEIPAADEIAGAAPAVTAPHTAAPPAEPIAEPNAAATLSTPSAPDGPWFTCYAVDTEYGESADDPDSESDSEEETGSSGGGGGGGGRGGDGGSALVERGERGAAAWGAGEWTHVQALLSAYNAREAAAGSTDVLAEADAPPPGTVSDDDGSESDDNEVGDSAAGGASAIRNAARNASGRGDRKGGSGGSGGGGGERYEKTPAHVRYMLRFQRRLGRVPDQVLRYVWDDVSDVLWPVPPAKRPSAVPACACGAARRLEVQVLPTLLYGLHVEDAPGGGMDFLSIFVYSCEDACDVSKEEWVWVSA